ncbi:MAG TPA: cytochrome c [Chitinophagales bacterium]|nr:cytochrome c [Chitinophagales bacterium]
MKGGKKFLIAQLVLLIAAGYTFTGCSSGNTQEENTVTASAPEKKVEKEEKEEEEEEAAAEEKSESADPYADWKNNKGIGPVKNLPLPAEVDHAMAEEGAKIYKEKCSSCHKPDKRFIGPAPKGIFERRTPEWVMNMILNPEVMVKEDPIARQLLQDYNLSPMANQHLTEEEARKVLEYFRTL